MRELHHRRQEIVDVNQHCVVVRALKMLLANAKMMLFGIDSCNDTLINATKWFVFQTNLYHG